MSKHIKVTLFLLLIFLMKVEHVSARFYGSYRYDIDSVTITDTSMTINGWAAVNSGGNNDSYLANPSNSGSWGTPVANIGGVYTLTIKAINNTGGLIASVTKNSLIRTADDYSRLWADESEGNAYTRYIGINYRFSVNVTELETLSKRGPNFNHFELELTAVAGGVTKRIPISFQTNVVNNTSSKVSISSNILTSVRVIVVQGRAQASEIIGGSKICYNNSFYYESPSVICDGAYRDIVFLKTGHIYNVNDVKTTNVLKVGGGANSVYVNSYVVRGYSNSTDLYSYMGYLTHNFLDGGSKTSYIPSAWIVPPTNNSVWLSLDVPTTSEIPKCSDGTMQCYCVTYPGDTAFCNTIDDVNNGSDNRNASCKTTGITTLTYQQPKSGYGTMQLNNNACRIDCQEDLSVTFQPQQTIKAGTGFTYPVTVNSTRYCTAKYDNAGWTTKMNTAVSGANNAVASMKSSVASADAIDNACGTKQTITVGANTCSKRTPVGAPTCDIDIFGKRVCKCPAGTSLDGSTCYRTTTYSCCKSPNYGPDNKSTCKRDVCSKNNGKLYSDEQNKIKSALDSASASRSLYNSNISTINTLTAERTTCNTYGDPSNNPYAGATSTSITTSGVPNQTSYRKTSGSVTVDSAFSNVPPRSATSTTYNISTCIFSTYTAPTLEGDWRSLANSFSGSYCQTRRTVPTTYRDYWNKKADATATYEFNQRYYVQTYTGELSTTAKSGYTNDGYKAYSGFYDMSGKYSFSLSVRNLGPNLPIVVPKTWSANPFTCSYNVNNLIFPQKGDPNYDRYGSIGFSFRPVSLTDPFPNRSARDNWRGKETLITSKGYNVYANRPLYTITLTPATMQTIRGFKGIHGEAYSYSDATNPSNSKLIDQYSSVIIRK